MPIWTTILNKFLPSRAVIDALANVWHGEISAQAFVIDTRSDLVIAVLTKGSIGLLIEIVTAGTAAGMADIRAASIGVVAVVIILESVSLVSSYAKGVRARAEFNANVSIVIRVDVLVGVSIDMFMFTVNGVVPPISVSSEVDANMRVVVTALL